MSEPAPIVLVVDDEIQIRRFLRTGFELNGFVVHEAGTGAEAIRTATLRPIDLAIVDLGLPDMDGADVVERIRSWSSVPIIVLSVRSTEAQKVHLLELGADDYVVKPFGMAELLARERVEQAGIIFLDEIDKVAGRERGQGPDVSREGVQRDLLPIVEGSTVTTKYGMVRTDHILFIAAGAFHVAKPADLIPELQGRFPIRVELEPLTRQDFVRILSEPRNALTRQYVELLRTEGVTVRFTPDAIEAIADIASTVNQRAENIGARRLHTVMERLLDELSFEAPDLGQKTVLIDEAYVDRMLADIVRNDDLSRYIL